MWKFGIINRDGNEFHSRFLLPIRVVFGNRIKLRFAWLAPRRPKNNDHGFAVIAKSFGIYFPAISFFTADEGIVLAACAKVKAAKRHIAANDMNIFFIIFAPMVSVST